MNWADYQVGRRVVCIEVTKDWPPGIRFLQAPPVPELGKVYTISDQKVGLLRGELCLSLQEFGTVVVSFLDRGELCTGVVMYEAKCFRPLDENRLDQFRKLLAPAPKDRVPA